MAGVMDTEEAITTAMKWITEEDTKEAMKWATEEDPRKPQQDKVVMATGWIILWKNYYPVYYSHRLCHSHCHRLYS